LAVTAVVERVIPINNVDSNTRGREGERERKRWNGIALPTAFRLYKDCRHYCCSPASFAKESSKCNNRATGAAVDEEGESERMPPLKPPSP